MRTTYLLTGLCFNVLIGEAQTTEQHRLLTQGYQPQPQEQALVSLVAMNRIGSNSQVDYHAGQAVVLQPGFEVKAGSVFTARTGAVWLLAAGEKSIYSLRMIAYPNPFDLATTISYVLNKPGLTSLYIHDSEGKLIIRLLDHQFQEAGSYQLEWKGGYVPIGTYLYTLMTGSERLSKRIIRK